MTVMIGYSVTSAQNSQTDKQSYCCLNGNVYWVSAYSVLKKTNGTESNKNYNHSVKQ